MRSARPLDGGQPLPQGPEPYWLQAPPVEAHRRRDLGPRLDLGVRALNLFTPCREGQRMGIFAGSGVGKSTLLAMLARHSDADALVLGLIGERGRELAGFLHQGLGPEGLARAVVVVATSDLPAMVRRRAAYVALTVAEALRDRGLRGALPVRQPDALCHGAARDPSRRGRAADQQGLSAERVRRAAASAGARRARARGGQHHGPVHGPGRGRRSARSARGCGARDPRWPHRARPAHRRGRAVPGDRRAALAVARSRPTAIAATSGRWSSARGS